MLQARSQGSRPQEISPSRALCLAGLQVRALCRNAREFG
jgi:hypothetical protein